MEYLRSLHVQVLAAIALGVLLGVMAPDWAVPLKPLGDGFIKMLIAPISFTTVVAGIAGLGDMKRAGRVGVKALVCFEIVTTPGAQKGLRS